MSMSENHDKITESDGNLNRNGRPKGVPNKVTKALKEMILGALDDAGGQEYLYKQALESPAIFCSLIGKILPNEIKGDIGITAKITHEQWLEGVK